MKRPKRNKAKSKRLNQPGPNHTQPSSLENLRKWLKKPTTWASGFFALLGMVISADWVRDQYDKTSPEVQAVDFDPASSSILPFIVKNPSGLFTMTDVNLSCYIDLAMFEDENKAKSGYGQTLSPTVSVPEIKAGTQVNFPCDARGTLRRNRDGSFAMGRPVPNNTDGSTDLTLTSMCVAVFVNYRTLTMPRKYSSPMFAWMRTGSGHKWLQGPLVSEKKTDVIQTCQS